jgi:hypothetical protein
MSTTTYPDGRVLFVTYRPETRAHAWRLLAGDLERRGSYARYRPVGSGVYYAPFWRGDPDGDLTDAMRGATNSELIPAWARGSADWRTGPDGAHGADYPDPLDR